MTNKQLSVLWGGMYILCAGLGFIPSPAGALSSLLTLLAIGFFIPGGVLLYRAYKAKDKVSIKTICALSGGVLGMTLLVLIFNFLSYGATQATGDLLYGLLIFVSSPMVCGQNWLIGLFGWACLLMSGLSCLKKSFSA